MAVDPVEPICLFVLAARSLSGPRAAQASTRPRRGAAASQRRAARLRGGLTRSVRSAATAQQLGVAERTPAGTSCIGLAGSGAVPRERVQMGPRTHQPGLGVGSSAPVPRMLSTTSGPVPGSGAVGWGGGVNARPRTNRKDPPSHPTPPVESSGARKEVPGPPKASSRAPTSRPPDARQMKVHYRRQCRYTRARRVQSGAAAPGRPPTAGRASPFRALRRFRPMPRSRRTLPRSARVCGSLTGRGSLSGGGSISGWARQQRRASRRSHSPAAARPLALHGALKVAILLLSQAVTSEGLATSRSFRAAATPAFAVRSLNRFGDSAPAPPLTSHSSPLSGGTLTASPPVLSSPFFVPWRCRAEALKRASAVHASRHLLPAKAAARRPEVAAGSLKWRRAAVGVR